MTVAALTGAIVDYGMGNLYSVQQACRHAGIDAAITADAVTVKSADVVILPGVGAFGDAMAALQELRLVDLLRRLVENGKPLVGLCLGMQLLMDVSQEYGRHEGLGLVRGDVVRLDAGEPSVSRARVPNIGWARIARPCAKAWEATPFEKSNDGDFMYFIHSFQARPSDSSAVLATSTFGDREFCAALRSGSAFGFQFHPERSGPKGLVIYEALASLLRRGFLQGSNA